MSSIDSILLTFRKTLEEKKQPLNEQYELTSQWLARELDLVRKLVQHDPRDPTPNFFEEMTPVPVVEAPLNKKRKSPETSSEIKLSPEQKRSSVDIKELLVACGLPADLNKLKKEQLLDELNKRGVKQFTMKNLKNELIDALENTIAAEKRNSFKSEHDAIESMVSSKQETSSEPISVQSMDVHVPVEPVVNTTAPVMEPVSAMKPRVRQGSLMDEFRKKVYTNNSVETENAQQKQKIENEFRNRQERHRDSIARKSQILEAPPTTQELEKENQEQEENVAVEEEIQVSKPFASEVSTAMDIVSPVKEISRPAEPEEDDVASESVPEEEEKEEIVNEEKDDEEAKENNVHVEHLSTDNHVVESEHNENIAHEQEEPSEKEEAVEEKEEISDIEEEETDKEIATSTILSQQDSIFQSTNNSQTSTKSSLSSTNSGTSHTEPAKKPLNLVGNASSFLDKQPKKPVIAALEKAKLLKEQEEMRELKKKEMKAAKLQAVSAASASNNAAANKEKDKNDPRSPWGKMAKGISKVADKVYPFGKKPTETATAAPAPAPVSAAPVKPPVTATSSNTNVKLSFDVRAVESKTSLSAAPVVSAPVAPVVESAPAVSHAQHTVPHSTSSHHTMPPKSVVKDIVSNYHNLVNHSNTHSHDNAQLTSPVRPLPPIAPTASAVTSTTSSSSASLAVPSVPVVNTYIAPAPVVAAPSVSVPMVAPVVAEVPKTVPVTQSAPQPVPPVATAPVAAETHVLRDKVISPAPVATPVAVVVTQPEEEDEDDYDPANNYEIEDTPDSDSDGGSGTEDEDESDKKKQQIPEWARGDKLREALERQYGLNGHTPMDPDLIFPEVQSCSLEEIFGRREGLNRKYNARTSSAHWDADELTLVEKRQYRVHMGYDNAATQQSAAQPRKLH